ncbi:DUF58 domain-containing protein [Methanoregula sp.]|uniref:DUF58 domain-containing protein n=1 Tax=Methanoregula sp. TaxID=2052170 RepID=UPI002602E1B7|nr:DUF58 domain-containing protein [Methanoregula sp.]MDD5141922.1 DUF58 domain-containing protein [Methanoregula sp.]
MQLRRCSQGICLVTLLLIAGALALDDPALLFAGSALAVAVLGQYLVFDRDIREIASSVQCRRTLGRNMVRRGTSLLVTTRITLRGLPRIHVLINELPPSKTLVMDGETTIDTVPGSPEQTYLCRYRIVPLIHGDLRFSGIELTFKNFFFSYTLRLSRETETGPVLSVLPAGLFQAPSTDSLEGSRDNRKASVLSTVDIHSLREYQPGDDLRHVDWKISAKYNKMYIRKYSSPTSHPPLLIVDLPWCGAPCPEKAFAKMISEVTGMVTDTLQSFQHISILFISGPNIIHLIREEKNPAHCLAELKEWMHPAERSVHFYRMPDRNDLRSMIRHCEDAGSRAQDPRVRAVLETLKDRYTGILYCQRNPAFAGQVTRTLSQLLLTNAYLFTLGCGDTSHIRHVVRPLRTCQVQVTVRVIEEAREGRPARRDTFSAVRGVGA